MHRTLTIGLIMLAAQLCGQGQTVHLYTDTVYGCAGDTIEVPLRAAGFWGVGSMTLHLNYDSQELYFDTCHTLHPLLPGMLVNHYLSPAPTIGFSWFTTNMNSANIGNGVLATLRFVMLSGSTTLSFSPQCEVTDSLGIPIQAVFTARPVLQFEIPVLQQPVDIITTVHGQGSFSIVPDQVQVAAQWQRSGDLITWQDLQDDLIFSGVNTTELHLTGIPDSLFGSAYRCRYQHGNCIAYSLHAFLLLDTTQYAGGYQRNTHLKPPYPNPFLQFITFQKPPGLIKYATFALYDMKGELVWSQHIMMYQPSQEFITLYMSEIQVGLYIAVLSYQDEQHNQRDQKHIIIKK